MKITLAWILLAVYLNASAQTVLPFVKDTFEHLFFWHDHLEHVHHGQVHSHHAQKEVLAKQDKGGDDQSSAHTFLSGEKVLSAHLPVSFSFEGDVPISFAVLNECRRFFYPNALKRVITPPPDFYARPC